MQLIPMILTRPEGSNAPFAAQLPDALRDRLRIIESPLIATKPLGAAVDLRPGEGVIFTSSNGVLHAPSGDGRRAYCVGASTTAAAAGAGWDAVEAGRDAAELIDCLLRLRPAMPLCHLSGVHHRGDIAETLAADGIDVRRIAIYEQPVLRLSEVAEDALQGDLPVLVPLFSARTAARFVELMPASASCRIVAMSEAVAEACHGIDPRHIAVAAQPTANGMIEAIEKTVRRIRLC